MKHPLPPGGANGNQPAEAAPTQGEDVDVHVDVHVDVGVYVFLFLLRLHFQKLKSALLLFYTHSN